MSQDKHNDLPTMVGQAGAMVDAATGLVAATGVGSALVAAPALVSALAGVVGPALERRRQERGRKYIERVVYHLATQNPEAAASFTSGNADRTEFVDAIERGYEQIRRAFDPLARECICLLVAQHALAADGRVPSDFVSVGSLLERSDLTDLVCAEAIATKYAELAPRENESVVVFQWTGGIFLVASAGRPMRFTPNAQVRGDDVRATMTLMAASGIGRLWSGAGDSPPEGAPNAEAGSQYSFVARDRERVQLLSRCLEPVRLARR